MKKYIIIALASGMVLSGCAKELVSENVETSPKMDGEISFVANADNSGDTKTSLEGTKIEWIQADQAMIFGTDGAGGTGNAKVSGYAAAASGESVALDWNMNISGTEGAFTSSQTPQYAFYPYNSTNVPSIDGSVITFVLPETQVYQKAASFGKDANVAVGKVTTSGGTGSIAFKNVCGYLRLKLSVASGDAATVGKIVLTTKGTEKLWGTFTADASSDDPTAAYKSGATDGGTSITLNCPDGVALSKDSANPTVFYFVVPAGALEDGFTAEVYSTQAHLIKTLSSTSSKTISRNSVKSIANQTLNWLPTGYEEKAYIESNGKQCIDTEYGSADGWRFDFKMQYGNNAGSYWPIICGVGSTPCELYDNYYYTSLDVNGNAGRFRYEYRGVQTSPTGIIDPTKGVEYAIDASFIKNNQYLTINGIDYNVPTYSTQIIQGDVTSCFCGRHHYIDPNWTYFSGLVAKWYYCNMYDCSNSQIRQFVPAFYSKGESGHQYGMYDVLNDVFYTNVYTGEGACDFSSGTI